MLAFNKEFHSDLTLSAFKLSWEYPSPIKISFHSFTHLESVIVKLETTDRVSGIGEAAPFKPITGDSLAEVTDELSKFLRGQSKIDLKGLSSIKSQTLRAAFDMALTEITAKKLQMSVSSFLTSKQQTPPNSVTIFIKDSIEETSKEAEKIFSLYPHLTHCKIKLSGSEDLVRCKTIMEVAPKKYSYVLDANQAFKDGDKAIKALSKICETLETVIAIEEPVTKGDFSEAKKITSAMLGPKILADESCCSEKDLKKIIRSKAFDGINIKLQKCGGITEGAKLLYLAEQEALSVMIGQMFETSLSTAAAIAVAESSPAVLFTDLDMDLELPRFFGAIPPFTNGSRSSINSEGFGLNLDETHPAVIKIVS